MHDEQIEKLLAETPVREPPLALQSRIAALLQHGRTARPARWPRWAIWPVAAAACVGLVWVLSNLATQPSERLPEAAVVPAPVRMAAEDAVRREVLGGYVELEMKPGTVLETTGSGHDQAVRLLAGEVHCKVQKGVGRFAVKTQIGDVRVIGTEFTVRYDREPVITGLVRGDMVMKRSLAVAVITGAVVVAAPPEEVMLQSGQSRVFAAAPQKLPPAPWVVKPTADVYMKPVIETLEMLNFDGDLKFTLTADQKREINKLRAEWRDAHEKFYEGEALKKLTAAYEEASTVANEEKRGNDASKALSAISAHFDKNEPSPLDAIAKIRACLTAEQRVIFDKAVVEAEKRHANARTGYIEYRKFLERML